MNKDSHSSQSNPSDAAHFVRISVAELRRKLLDITARNPLISFKHGGRSRRFVRVVDELPDQMFQKLEDGAAMTFRSLGSAENEPEDEKHINFTRALAAAKFDDPDYLKGLEELGEDPGERALEQLETELRIRLRERLGMPPRRPVTTASAADVAQKRGINTSFDLPTAATSEMHSDMHVQTLLFDDQLERTLSGLQRSVNLSVTETGVNPLFAVFGFLEWYEDANSSVALHAPLLLYPLNVERTLVRGHWRYTLQKSDENPSINVALLERLKRDFQIVLPPFGEDDTPESYFLHVQKVIEVHRNWKVRRWLTIGLLSFARIAMYHDLNEENWASQGGLEAHERLTRLLAGGGGSGGGDTDHEYAAEDDDAHLDEFDIPLIADADSSQIKAVRDVLSGRDLVIEGPPGTGKSQTILNIIAAALAQGKSVLFLAEKMAALNVVRDRLAQANLEKFCLELHSTKAGKKETYAALARRRMPHQAGAIDAELEATLRNLGIVKKQLHDCVEALAQPAGKLGITIQELLWRCHRVRQQTSEAPSEIDELMLDGTDLLTDTDLDRVTSTAIKFEQTRAAVLEQYGSIRAHPWFGIASADMNPFQAEDAVRRMKRLSDAAGAVASLCKELESLAHWNVKAAQQLDGLQRCVEIDSPAQEADDGLVAKLAEGQSLAYMEEFVRQIQEFAELRTGCEDAFVDGTRLDQVQLSRLKELAKVCSANESLASVTIGDLPGLADNDLPPSN